MSGSRATSEARPPLVPPPVSSTGLHNLRGTGRGRVAVGLQAGLTGAQPVIRKRAASGEACATWLLRSTQTRHRPRFVVGNELRDRRASTASFLHLSACVAIWAVISFWFCKGGHLITMRDPVVRLPIAYYVRGGKLRLALISASSAPLRRIKRRGKFIPGRFVHSRPVENIARIPYI